MAACGFVCSEDGERSDVRGVGQRVRQPGVEKP